MGSFALIEDYYEFKGLVYPPTPELTEAQLAAARADLTRCSDAVRGMLRLARYRRAADGLPALEAQREAMVRATCAQLDWIRERGDDFTGAGSEWDSVALLEVSFSKRAGSSGSTQTARKSIDAPEAERILVNAGFFGTGVNHPGGAR